MDCGITVTVKRLSAALLWNDEEALHPRFHNTTQSKAIKVAKTSLRPKLHGNLAEQRCQDAPSYGNELMVVVRDLSLDQKAMMIE